jgi:glutamate synthase (NADPH/NADH) small chain
MFSPLKAWKYLLRKPVTISKKDVFDSPREASDNYRGFHTNDWEKCVGCGTCGEICPTNAITMLEIKGLEEYDGHKPERPAVDYGRCSFCGLCVDICTTDSLKMSKEYLHISKDADTFYFLPKEDGLHKVPFDAGYVRDETSELLDLDRYQMDEIPHEGRNESFIELIKGYSKEMALAEAARCVECGVCTNTCPAGMNIPEYIRSVWTEDLAEGASWLYETNPLSNVCGRICTHKCETACVIGQRGEAVAIRWLKRYIVDNTPEEDFLASATAKVSKQVNGKVGIIGSGPAGLSCGYYLRTMGYDVDIYEEKPLPGGVVRYGAPEYRLPEDRVKKDIEVIEKSGVKIITNTKVGRDITLDEMKEKYDAVFAGTGYWIPKKLRIENVDHPDVKFSTYFLAESRDYTRGMGHLPEFNDDIIVIGGGDVSFDVARTLNRFQIMKDGKANVRLVARKPEEFLAASLDEVAEAKEEGVIYKLNLSPTKILIGEDNKIYGIEVVTCQSHMEDGRAKTVCGEETEIIYGTDVYLGVGNSPDFNYLSEEMMETLKIEKDKIAINENGQIEGYPWLFAGGDIVHGPDIITAVADGHRAAVGIDAFIMGNEEVE